MPTWESKIRDVYTPPVTKNIGGEVVSKVIQEPNLIVDSGTVLGSWDLGSSSFSKAQSEKVTLAFSGKGRLASVDIRNQQDNPHTLLGVAFVFKLKKPGK
jgi:hypothetical protein